MEATYRQVEINSRGERVDKFLTGNPEISFFKQESKRYYAYARNTRAINFETNPNFGTTSIIKLNRYGDLVGSINLELELPPLVGTSTIGYCNNIGHAIIDNVYIEIGGQTIDRHYGKWLTIWNYLTEDNPTGEQGAIDDYSTGPGEYTTNPIYGPAGSGDNSVTEVYPRATRYNRMAYTHRAQVNVKSNEGAAQLAWVPLQFWFCRNPGLALPLIALQYHEVKIFINLAQLPYITNMPSSRLTGREFARFAVYADYV